MNGTFFCNKCGAQNAAGAQFCNRCGAPTSPDSGRCPDSGGIAAISIAQLCVVEPRVAAIRPASATAYQAVAPVAGVGYGGFWIRVVAAIIDSIILRVVVAPVGMIFGGLGMAGMMSGIPHRGLDFWAAASRSSC